MKSISEFQDKQYAEFKKEQPNGTFYDYNIWCHEKDVKETNEKLKKHYERNNKFLNKIGHAETLYWANEQMKRKPVSKMLEASQNRTIQGFDLFAMGHYNNLMMELTRDTLNKKVVTYHLDALRKNKEELIKT